ncbi:GumC family protein [Pseudomarimonas salicorniae]|uniref:Polysaccharide chain length determinant N-terminal domain-containing protein n=1 Tax=Pseudomarimonas salicorniae TaxID=2933270 RepID=A0ABT0GEX1_9GAMM|nr:hypothetical protein [Lysobacter sp. CAU 1642]MCK7593086.1 hypothetical protein [Lysobacter sp. CAU 1642]
MNAGDFPLTPVSVQHTNAMPMLPPEYLQPAISARQFATILWTWRRLTLLIGTTVMALAAVAIAFWPRTYQATATLMVNFEVNDPLAGREFPTGLLASYMATQLELAGGLQIMLAVVDRLDLTTEAKYTDGFTGAGDDISGLRSWAALQVQRQVSVDQGRYGSQLLSVTFEAGDPAAAAEGANAVAEVYAEQQHQRLTGPANERAQRYTEQLGELKDKVALAQEQVTAFRLRSGLIDSESKYDVDILLLSTLQQRLLEAQTARRVAAARAASDQSVGNAVLNSNMVQSLKAQIAAGDVRLADLTTTLGPRHPQVLELQSQQRVANRALSKELRAYAGNARNELQSASLLERNLLSAVDSQRTKVLEVREVQDRGAKYQLELASAQAVYKRALDGNDQVLFASAGAYRNVDFVSRATPPSKPSKPKFGMLLLLACAAAAGLALAVPFCYEMLNRRVRTRDDLERDLGIPVLIDLGPTASSSASLTAAAA